MKFFIVVLFFSLLFFSCKNAEKTIGTKEAQQEKTIDNEPVPEIKPQEKYFRGTQK